MNFFKKYMRMTAVTRQGSPAINPAGTGPNNKCPPVLEKYIPIALKLFNAPCPITAGMQEPVFIVTYESIVPNEKQKTTIAAIPVNGYRK